MNETNGFKSDHLKERLTRLGEFAAIFEANGFQFAEMRGGKEIEPGTFEMPWSHLSDAAMQFNELCYADGWVLSEFNWPEWGRTSEAAGLLNDTDHPSPGLNLVDANPEQLAKLITAIIRADRFCEGYLEGAFESGLLVGIVRRASELAAQK